MPSFDGYAKALVHAETGLPRKPVQLVLTEWPLVATLATAALFLVFGKEWLANLTGPFWFAFVLLWLFGAILIAAFAVVRHAEGLAVRLGEPLGTLVLTISLSAVELLLIAAIMYAGQGESSLGRDTMLAIIMIVLNGLVGTSLVLGGRRYHEQTHNVHGANALLSVIMALSVLGLVLPRYAVSSPGPTSSPLQAGFLIFMSVGLYGVFLAVQTLRHRDLFVSPNEGSTDPAYHGHMARLASESSTGRHHAVLLLAYALPIVFLANQIAVPIDYGIRVLEVPAALGGLLIAILILCPASLAAIRAAMANELQRSINLSLGTALSSISMTIPAVLAIGFMMDRTVILGLDAVDMVLLFLTLFCSMLTFSLERTNVLTGAIHLILFLAYLMLIFEK